MSQQAAATTWIDGRYRLDGVLGRGGMSTVYRAWDTRTERACALKCLRGGGDQTEERRHLSALFQREFATLGQLAHPSIIEVYDYGIETNGPYYTMELLEGKDLRRLAPLPWPAVCGLLRDVASALALLHSRRLIHRDVTANNVHRASDGRAKLMDFGAMTDMGVPAQLVGTPPYIAPEALQGQALDERVDLFALGALAYLALTGRNAYPANTMAQLQGVWRVRPAKPSTAANDIPSALSELVMALLSIDARARPGSAAEVIERLTAIADLPRDSRIDTARAYLIRPPLLGRDRELQALRWQLSRAQRGNGGALLFEAPSGLGKSRMLETSALEARQSGALSLLASGETSRGQDFALLRALACALLEAAPELALTTAREHVPVLGHVLPELRAAMGTPELLALDAKQLHVHVQAAALAWLRSVASEQWLALAIDDVQDADAPSLLLLVELARAAPALKLHIAAACRSGADARAGKRLELLRTACVPAQLSALDAPHCEALVRALFGDVSNAKLVAGWAYGVAQGNPQAILDLAQHLVDGQVARYENGRWAIGPELPSHVLPRSLTDAHRSRVETLSPNARALAEALSLAGPHAALDLGVYPEFLPHEPALRVFTALDELVARRFVVASGPGHAFVHRELGAAVAAGIDPGRARSLNAALAAIEQRRGDLLQAAHHLEQAGQPAEALELMLQYGALPRDDDPTSRGFALTPSGVALLQRSVAAAEAARCAPHRKYFLHRRLLQLSAYVNMEAAPIAEPLLAQLSMDAGLDLFDPSDPDPAQFTTRCFPRAQARYDALSESERGLSPLDAVRELAHVIVALTGAYGRVLDTRGMQRLNALLVPLRHLAPVVTLLHDITAAACDRVRGRRFSDRVDDVLARLAEGVPGLDEVTRGGARRTLTYYVALEQAQLCNPKVLAYADFIAEDPVHEPLAWHLRMVKHLYSGEALRARACRDRTELLALRQPEGFSQLATSVVYETEARTLCGDLLALKEALPRLDQLAEQSAGFRGFARTVRAEYEMLRGRGELACEALADVMAAATPGETTEWSRAVTSYVEALLQVGEFDRAIAEADRARTQSRALRLNPLYPVMLGASMAQALARRGEGGVARDEVQRALEEARALGMDGVPLGRLHEAGARVALSLGDWDAFALHAEHARVQYTRGGDPQLVARHQRLLYDAQHGRGGTEADGTGAAAQPVTARGRKLTSSLGRLSEAPPGERRIALGLSLLTLESGAAGACLYAVAEEQPRLVASDGRCAPAAVEAFVEQHLREELLARGSEVMTYEATHTPAQTGWVDDEGTPVQPLLLTTVREGRSVVAGLLVLWSLPRHQLPWPLIYELTDALLEHSSSSAPPA